MRNTKMSRARGKARARSEEKRGRRKAGAKGRRKATRERSAAQRTAEMVAGMESVEAGLELEDEIGSALGNTFGLVIVSWAGIMGINRGLCVTSVAFVDIPVHERIALIQNSELPEGAEDHVHSITALTPEEYAQEVSRVGGTVVLSFR